MKTPLDLARDLILDKMVREGYIKTPQDYSHLVSSKGKSPQWDIRQGIPPRSFEECMTATLEALVLQGGVSAYPGDGTSCVQQMIWAQHDRAERAEKALASAIPQEIAIVALWESGEVTPVAAYLRMADALQIADTANELLDQIWEKWPNLDEWPESGHPDIIVPILNELFAIFPQVRTIEKDIGYFHPAKNDNNAQIEFLIKIIPVKS